MVVHCTRKSIHDQDNADLRAVKEMFLPDGDLYTDGQGRTRHFRWRGIDENSQFDLFGNKELWGDEEGEAVELSTEEEIQRRKERYEREAFLREEMVSIIMIYFILLWCLNFCNTFFCWMQAVSKIQGNESE